MLIKGGTIIDGTGKPRFKGDIRIEEDTIKEIDKKPLKEKGGEYVIEAEGKFVTPGFIDIINRSDVHFSLILCPGLNSLVKQGITTIVGGSCGASLAPLINREAIFAIRKWQDIRGMNINWIQTSEFFAELESRDITLNFATLTGHGTLRRGISGDDMRPLTIDEMKKMKYLLEESLEQGSFGLSVGLAYSHEKVALYGELSQLTSVLRKYNAMYATHLRDEGEDLLIAVNELLTIARESEVGSHIYHFKAMGEKWWSQFDQALEMVNTANNTGSKVTFDTYPYTSTATVLYLLLPDWVSDGGKGKVLARLKNKAIRAKITKELSEDRDEISKIIIASGGVENIAVGKTIGSIATRSGSDPIDVLFDIIVASNDRVIGFIPTLNQENLEKGIANKYSFIGSDGAGYGMKDVDAGMLVHPRSFGTFPKFLAEYVRDKNLVSWEEGIKKITSAPAEKIGFTKRGRLEKGYSADVLVFDPKKLEAKSTFENPFQYSEGIDYVVVNGGLAIRDGKFQKKKHGKVLKRSSS